MFTNASSRKRRHEKNSQQHYHKQSNLLVTYTYESRHIRKQQLSVSCSCCFNFIHHCHTRSAAVCQFAQHYAAAEIIQAAAAWTDSHSTAGNWNGPYTVGTQQCNGN